MVKKIVGISPIIVIIALVVGAKLAGVLGAIIEGSQEYLDFKNQFSKLFDNKDSEVRKELNILGTKVEVYLQMSNQVHQNLKSLLRLVYLVS